MINEDVTVHDSEGKEIRSQLLPLMDTHASLRTYHVKAYLGQSPPQTPKYWLAFSVSVPPLGFSSYVISSAKSPGPLIVAIYQIIFLKALWAIALS